MSNEIFFEEYEEDGWRHLQYSPRQNRMFCGTTLGRKTSRLVDRSYTGLTNSSLCATM
jgi:hypothetical protein